MVASHSGTVAHKRARAALLAQHRDGDRCARCGRPTYRWQPLEADHVLAPHALDPGAVPDALSHRACNRYAGAVLAGLLRGVTIGEHRDEQMETVRLQVIAIWNARRMATPPPQW